MKSQLTPSQSKALAVGLFFMVVVVALIYALLLEPAMSLYQTNNKTIDELSSRLNRYQYVAAGVEVLKKELGELSQNEAAKDYYLTSKTAALASAELQAHVKNVIDDVDGRLVSTQPLAENDRSLSRLVKIQVRMAGDIETVQKALYRLEFGNPGLLIDEVSIARMVRSRRRPTSTQPVGSLDVRFNLTGFMQGAAS
jgi:hypothetical protein